MYSCKNLLKKENPPTVFRYSWGIFFMNFLFPFAHQYYNF